MKRYRVAHVITRLCRGGAQENTFHTVRLADRERFDVDLISGPTDGAEGSLEPDIAAAGIDIKRIPTLKRSPSPINDYRAYRDLLALFRRERYDIVHTHTSKAGYVARIAAKRAGVPIIVHTPHGHIFFGYYASLITKFFIALERHAAKHTGLLIALTPTGLEDHLARRIGRREQWRVIGSGIDLSPFETARARREDIRVSLGVNGISTLMGYVGRLEPVKGVAYFVEAARAVAERNPHARFVVVGDGAERGALERAAAPLGDRMAFLGFRNDVPDLMAALDVLVLPSLNEGMGRVLVEAAAAGTPVIASKVGGVPDIVRDGETGFLVAPGDANAIAEAALTLVDRSDQRERFGEAARVAVAPKFCLNAMVAGIEAEYMRLMKEKHLAN
jgi:glycosyltransferase involved in cell wall biosynthesis